jgi:hypothetical protein
MLKLYTDCARFANPKELTAWQNLHVSPYCKQGKTGLNLSRCEAGSLYQVARRPRGITHPGQ